MIKTITYFFLFFTSITFSKKCFDYQLTDGAEELLEFGLDSTNNWWAITGPFTNQARLIVNGDEMETVYELTRPVFSQDGLYWGSYMRDNAGWNLVTNDTSFRVSSRQPGEILFARNNSKLIYSYFQGNMERIHHDDKVIEVFGRIGNLHTDVDGNDLAYVRDRNGIVTVNINGRESTVFDQIKPIGFLTDGNFYFAGGVGGLWHIYKNDEIVSETYNFIDQVTMNPDQTIAAFSGVLQSNFSVAVVIDPRYENFIESERYNIVSNLTLHPFEPLVAFGATFNDNFSIYMSSVAYNSGRNASIPRFTHNGEDLFFIACTINCFASINGVAYQLGNLFDLDKTIAVKPGSGTFAFVTGNSLVVRGVEETELWSGMMVDYVDAPRYNRFEDRYEALGVINNRLFLLTCTE